MFQISPDGEEFLPTVEMVINSLPNRSTGYSPFFLVYGYHPVLPIELLKGDESTNVETVSKIFAEDTGGSGGTARMYRWKRP